MTTPVVFGLGGLLTSGKDVFADTLRTSGAHRYVKVGMSDPLLMALLTTDPYIPQRWRWQSPVRYSALYSKLGYVKTKKIPEVRRLLQVIGTEVGREQIDQNVWVDIARRHILAEVAKGNSVILTGVRFENEVEMVRSLSNSLTVWMERGGLTSSSMHASENTLSAKDFQLTIRNDSTLQQLEELVLKSETRMIGLAEYGTLPGTSLSALLGH